MKTYDMSRMSRWKISILLLLALGMLFCFGLISRLEHFTREAPLYLSYYSIAFTLYVFACLLLWKVDLEEYQGLLIAVFTAAILFRVLFWFTQPSLSTDVWRYIWDGRLVSQGVNPYLERVDTLIVDREAELLRSRVQHQWMASPYPPAAQAAFGIIYSIFPMSATAMQITFSLIDLASGVLLVRILTRLRLPSGRALLYLWNPLVVIEFAHSGHLDSLMILLVLMAILSSLNGRQNVSAVSLGLATVTKYIPALFLPLFIRRWGWKKLWIYFSIITIAYLPFVRAGLGLDATAGTGLFGAARIYARQWSTNGGIYIWLVNNLRNYGVSEPELIVKGITVLALAMLGLWLLSLPERKQTHDAGMIIEAMTILFSVYLLLSAAVFPWYLTLMVALAAALPVYQSRPWRLVVIAWIYFSGAVNLSYLFYINPANPGEIEWVLRVEYIPLLILLAAAVVLKLIESRQAAAKRNMLS
jgi:hypothetical protein